jgi:SynChlorMet cassette radical SAM/SPASM protein ScmF
MLVMAERMIQLPDGVPPLTQYYVYLTSGCNLACRHCWLTPTYQLDGGTGGHLDFELFKLALEEGLPLGLQTVKLTGGEPLLHPDFVRIVDLIKEMELGLIIETNGTLMTAELANHLKEQSTLSHISVSLDGASAETHDPFRGVKGSFEKAVQGIRYLVGAGFSPQIIMSIHVGNVDEIEALVRLAEKLGAGSIKFNIIQPTGRGEMMTERGQTLDVQRLVELGKWIETKLQKCTLVRLHYSWPIAFHGINHLLSGSTETCGIFNVLGILSTGHLAMCGIGVQIPELCYGLLGKDNVVNIWNFHPMLINLRQNLPSNLEGICGECIFRNKCLGSCVASNYQGNNSLVGPHWFCQMSDDAMIFPISKRRKSN